MQDYTQGIFQGIGLWEYAEYVLRGCFKVQILILNERNFAGSKEEKYESDWIK